LIDELIKNQKIKNVKIQLLTLNNLNGDLIDIKHLNRLFSFNSSITILNISNNFEMKHVDGFFMGLKEGLIKNKSIHTLISCCNFQN
jgi:hypothetical protein